VPPVAFRSDGRNEQQDIDMTPFLKLNPLCRNNNKQKRSKSAKESLDKDREPDFRTNSSAEWTDQGGNCLWEQLSYDKPSQDQLKSDDLDRRLEE
jgi:hypothetical protein